MNKEDGRDKKRMVKPVNPPRKRLDAAVFRQVVKKRGYERYGKTIIGSNREDDLDDFLEDEEYDT